MSIWLYAYLTRITLHGGAWKMAKIGESQTGSVSFLSWCSDVKLLLVIFISSTFKFELFQEIFYL